MSEKTNPVANIQKMAIAISVSNIKESVKWYSGNFGFQVMVEKEFPAMGMKMVFMEAGGLIIELIESEGFIADKRPPAPASANKQGVFQISFRVKEIDKVYESVKSSDIHLEYEMVTNEELKFKAFLIRDNDGNIIEILEEF